MASQIPSASRRSAFRSQCFSFEKNCSITDRQVNAGRSPRGGIRVGGILWQEEQPGSGAPNGLALVGAEIVHDDDIAGPERGHEDFLHIDTEALAVDRPVEMPGCLDPLMTQRRHKGLRAPSTMRRGAL